MLFGSFDELHIRTDDIYYKTYAKNNMTNLFSSKNLKYQEVLL